MIFQKTWVIIVKVLSDGKPTLLDKSLFPKNMTFGFFLFENKK